MKSLEKQVKISSREIGEALAKMPEKARLEFLLDVLDEINGSTDREDLLCLVVVDTSVEDDETPLSNYLVFFVGRATTDWVDDAIVSQEGWCGDCNIDILSWSKHAYCPICGQEIYLT